eukprot:1178908-Prorocentrum_minimum.AAC.1
MPVSLRTRLKVKNTGSIFKGGEGGKLRSSVDASEPQNPSKSEEYQRLGAEGGRRKRRAAPTTRSALARCLVPRKVVLWSRPRARTSRATRADEVLKSATRADKVLKSATRAGCRKTPRGYTPRK